MPTALDRHCGRRRTRRRQALTTTSFNRTQTLLKPLLFDSDPDGGAAGVVVDLDGR
jgi:hypothetical protein